MKKIQINDQLFLIIENNNGIDEEILKEKLTEYFDPFDYIVGDWAYGKLRLKGFNKKDNPNFKPINDFDDVEDYLKKQCAYGCRYFILERKLQFAKFK